MPAPYILPKALGFSLIYSTTKLPDTFFNSSHRIALFFPTGKRKNCVPDSPSLRKGPSIKLVLEVVLSTLNVQPLCRVNKLIDELVIFPCNNSNLYGSSKGD